MKWAILTLISIFICGCCFQMLEWDSSGNLIAHSFSIWGDWSAHFTFISNLLNRGTHWLSGDNPVFYGMPFQYPFLSHLLTASFSFLSGMEMTHATFYTSILLLFSLPFVLFHFFKSIGLSVRQAILGVLLFLFLSGLQGFDSSLNAAEPLTNQLKAGSVFTQIVLFELFPQRAFLFGLVFLLGILSFAFNRFKKSKFTRSNFIILTIAFALLAWTHLHSWISMGAILLIYFLFNLFHERTRKNGDSPKNISMRILYFGIAVVLASAPLLYFLLLRPHSDHYTASAAGSGWKIWYPGWAQNPAAGLDGAQNMNPIFFWIYNTGLFLPLAIFGKARLWKSRPPINNPIVVLGFVGSILFLIAEFLNIQPYFYDNLKLFTYAFLFFAPLSAIGLDWFFEKKKWLAAVGIILLFAQIYTATQDFIFFKNHGQNVAFISAEEFQLAENFKVIRRSSESLIINAPKHNHWVSTLTGNPIFMGYPGWLWTWDISYREREIELNEALTGGSKAMEIFARYPIEYIVVSDHDRFGNAPVNLGFLREHFTPVMEQNAWHVFKAK